MYSFIQDFHIVLSYNKKKNENIKVDLDQGRNIMSWDIKKKLLLYSLMVSVI